MQDTDASVWAADQEVTENMATVYVNDKPVDIGTEGSTASRPPSCAGVFIPHYCWHPALTVVAVCRMCLVEVGDLKDGKVDDEPKVVPGCQTPVKDGTVIVTGEYDKRDRATRPALRHEIRRPASAPRSRRPTRSKGCCSTTRSTARCATRPASASCRTTATSTAASETPDGRREEHAAEQAGHLSRTITLFTDRCIMCTRCVRFTREISRHRRAAGHQPRRTTPRSTSSPASRWTTSSPATSSTCARSGRSASKDFLYKQRVWYLKTTDSVCPGCSTGCSIHVDANKDIVYRLRPRENPQAQGYFMCDEGRYGYHYANAAERIMRPLRPQAAASSAGRRTPRSLPAAAARTSPTPPKQHARGVVAVLSPFLTVEEAYLLGQVLQGAVAATCGSPSARCRWSARTTRYPKDRRGNPVEPVEVHDPGREVPEPPRRRGGAASTSRAR